MPGTPGTHRVSTYTRDIARERRTGLIFSLAAFVFLSAITIGTYIPMRESIEQQTDQSQFEELAVMRTAIESSFAHLDTQLVQLSFSPAIADFLARREEATAAGLEQMFSEMVEFSTYPVVPTFDQMRLLSPEGEELIRVDLGPDGRGVITEQSQLQDKSNRYYFTEGIRLDDTSIYVSPLDLNIELGEIETPHNPVLRVSKTVFAPTGELLGLLVINQSFQSVFDQIEELNAHPGDQWYLVNQEGYYLRSPDPSDDFRFMFPELEPLGMFSVFPQIWEGTRNATGERMENETGAYFAITISLGQLTNSTFRHADGRVWYLVMNAPRAVLRQEVKVLNQGTAVAIALIAPLLIVLGWMYGRSLARNRHYRSSLEEMATRDGLTGLYNQRSAMEQLDYQLRTAARSQRPVSVAFLDLNDLKILNDTKGHDAGDTLIVAAAEAIDGAIRDTDIAARVGGDEFLLIMPDLPESGVGTVVQELQSEFSRIGESAIGQETTLSWGVASWRGTSDTRTDLVARADASMYEMKKAGKSMSRDPNRPQATPQ